MGALVDIKVPDIGDFTDVEVIEVMVKPGDPVRVDDSLITIESDKASMEVPATEAGVVKEIRVKVGDKVSEGSPIVVIETAAAADGKEAATAAPAPAAKPAQAPTLAVVKKPAPAAAQPAKQAKPRDERWRPWTLIQMRNIADAAQGRYKAMMHTLATGGFRRGELLALKRVNVDWGECKVYVEGTEFNGEWSPTNNTVSRLWTSTSVRTSASSG